MKRINKICLKVMSLVIVCIMCFQFCSITGYAETLKKDWSLYYNASSPSAEWKLHDVVYEYSNRDYTYVYATQLDYNATVNLEAPAAIKGYRDYTFLATGYYKVCVVKGLNTAYNFSYDDYGKYANSAKGYVKYYH